MASLPARLTDPWFEAEFYGEVNVDESYRIAHEDGSPMTFKEAQGLFLWCPCGYGALDANGVERYPLDLSLNKGRPHGVLIPFANPPCGILLPPNHGPVSSRDGVTHPRWVVNGSGLHDLTVTPSIAVGNPECWHGFIRNGEVTR
jgi:hypothetical protein